MYIYKEGVYGKSKFLDIVIASSRAFPCCEQCCYSYLHVALPYEQYEDFCGNMLAVCVFVNWVDSVCYELLLDRFPLFCVLITPIYVDFCFT